MKKYLRKFVLSSSVLLMGWNASAQNEVDALRYAFQGTPGSSRSLGMGGAFGALGADASSFWNNPAGLGVYKRSSLEFGLNINDRISQTNFMGNAQEDSKSKLNLSHLSFVTSKQSEEDSKLRASVGIGVGLLNNYNQRFSANGTSNTYTLLDVFATQASGVPTDEIYTAFPFGAGMAYETYLIDPFDTIAHTYIPAEFADGTKQNKTVDRSGRMIETTFGGAINYDEKLSLGMTIGIQSIYFKETSSYSESFPNSTYLSEYGFNENITAYGNGINVRLGGIYNIGKWLRVGASWQSPTKLVMSDAYSTSMVSNFRDGSRFDSSSPELLSTYNVRVPAKVGLSTAFILGKSGVVSADYESTRFDRIRMNSKGLSSAYSYDQENSTIEDIYRVTHKVKMGMEIRLIDVLRLRAGAIYQTSPFVQGASNSDPIITYTGGIGYRKGAFFADFAFMMQKQNESYWIYDPRLTDQVRIQNQSITGNIGIGLKF